MKRLILLLLTSLLLCGCSVALVENSDSKKDASDNVELVTVGSEGSMSVYEIFAEKPNDTSADGRFAAEYIEGSLIVYDTQSVGEPMTVADGNPEILQFSEHIIYYRDGSAICSYDCDTGARTSVNTSREFLGVSDGTVYTCEWTDDHFDIFAALESGEEPLEYVFFNPINGTQHAYISSDVGELWQISFTYGETVFVRSTLDGAKATKKQKIVLNDTYGYPMNITEIDRVAYVYAEDSQTGTEYYYVIDTNK